MLIHTCQKPGDVLSWGILYCNEDDMITHPDTVQSSDTYDM